ncbi:MAG: UDP-glucose/GDP-mannose dehydrogenase family protein [Dehalococcoidales bacterium]|nr:UDP-glucose/GDP-mannose dehydrogenase family protein [Dehalococcoidales bacterium]
MKNICIVGSGHVGLVTGACLAELGNKVICMDDDENKIEGLHKGVMPFFEPDLDNMVRRNVDAGKLSFTANVEEAVKNSEIVFVCVGTPQKPDGEADLTQVEIVAQRVARAMHDYTVVVEKSTVPVKTGGWVKRTIALNNINNADFDVVSNPEFLREGKAVYDFMHPDRIVIGAESERAAQVLLKLYEPLKAPVIVTSITTAELIKHASNAFLATKISYINALANICEGVDADIAKVAEGMGYDRRIGRDFLNAGIGYGGYCLPKDTAAFIRIAEEAGYDFELLKAVRSINEHQRQQLFAKVKKELWNLNGKTIGILGLAFKPDTDDMREAPAIDLIGKLLEENVQIKAYDPQAMETSRAIFPDIQYCKDAYEVAEGSDALVIVTEWNEFKNLDFEKVRSLLRQPIIIDGRNLFDPDEMGRLGFIYRGFGR